MYDNLEKKTLKKFSRFGNIKTTKKLFKALEENKDMMSSLHYNHFYKLFNEGADRVTQHYEGQDMRRSVGILILNSFPC